MVKKGDTVIYNFGFNTIEAKVLKVYGEDYVKVRHKGDIFDFFYRDIIPVSKILAVESK